MAHTISVYQEGIKALFGASDFSSDTVTVALFTSGYVPNYQTDDVVNDFVSSELNNGGGDTNGYYAGHGNDGRQDLGSKTMTASSGGLVIDAADVTFASLAAALADVYGAVIMLEGTSDDTDAVPVAYVDFDPIFDPNASDLLIQWNSSGIFAVGNGTIS